MRYIKSYSGCFLCQCKRDSVKYDILHESAPINCAALHSRVASVSYLPSVTFEGVRQPYWFMKAVCSPKIRSDTKRRNGWETRKNSTSKFFLIIPDFPLILRNPDFFLNFMWKLPITPDFQLFTLKKNVNFKEWSLNNCLIVFCWCTLLLLLHSSCRSVALRS